MPKAAVKAENTITPELADAVALYREGGWGDERIAAKTGLTLAEVLSVDVGEPEFTSRQDAQILSLRNEKGRLWMRIAEELGSGITADQVKRRYGRLMRHSLRGGKVSRAAKILCLGTCGEMFQSSDSVNNRLCRGCSRAASSAVACGLNMFATVTENAPDLVSAARIKRDGKLRGRDVSSR